MRAKGSGRDRDMKPRAVLRLTLALATLYAAVGTLEVILKVAEESAIATIAGTQGGLLSGVVLTRFWIVTGCLLAWPSRSLPRPLCALGMVALLYRALTWATKRSISRRVRSRWKVMCPHWGSFIACA